MEFTAIPDAVPRHGGSWRDKRGYRAYENFSGCRPGRGREFSAPWSNRHRIPSPFHSSRTLPSRRDRLALPGRTWRSPCCRPRREKPPWRRPRFWISPHPVRRSRGRAQIDLPRMPGFEMRAQRPPDISRRAGDEHGLHSDVTNWRWCHPASAPPPSTQPALARTDAARRLFHRPPRRGRGQSRQLPTAINAADRGLHDIGVPRQAAGDFLQNSEVRDSRSEVEPDGARNWSHRIVWADADAEGGGRGRNLLADREAAAMAEVRLHVGHRVQATQILIFLMRDQAFSRGDRAFRELRDLRHGNVIAGLDRLFNEHRARRGTCIDIGQRRAWRERPAVEIEQDIHLVAGRTTQGLQQFFGVLRSRISKS